MGADPRAWAARLPDEPRWVDFRGLLLSGRVVIQEDAGGCAFISRDLHLGAVIGAPGPATLELLHRVAPGPDGEPPVVLAQPEDAPALVDFLPGWSPGAAILHRWTGFPPADSALAALEEGVEVRLIPPGEPLRTSAFGSALAGELLASQGRGNPTAMAFVAGKPAAVCSSAFETEGLWDVSIDTLPDFRRRGLAAACFAALAAAQQALGRQPVWGAEAGNEASLRLAARLGFVAAAWLALFTAPRERLDG